MGSKRPMQSLILEILQAQPSLRDSKTYLNSFGPRQLKPGKRTEKRRERQQETAKPSFPLSSAEPRLSAQGSVEAGTSRLARLVGSKRGGPAAAVVERQRRDVEKVLPPDILEVAQARDAQSTSKPAAAQVEADSHHFAQPDLAVRTAPDASLSRASLDAPVTPASQAVLAEQLSTPPVQQHTALVKVQGPFTTRQLESIADGMVYLKRLGLVSVIVLDSEDLAWRGVVSEFSSEDGKLIDPDADRDELAGLAQWMRGEGDYAHDRSPLPSRSTSVGKVQEVLRKHMLSEVTKLAELLNARGAPARPFPHAMMRVDADAVARADAASPPNVEGLPARGSRGSELERENRSPLVSDDSLSSVRSALAHDTIPIVAPLALYNDPETQGSPRTVCVPADDVLVGLAREMAAEGRAVEEMLEDEDGLLPEDIVDMMPLRLMVINREGGIPSHARGGNPHLSINLASEYAHIMNSFVWHETNPTAISNLNMVRDCLAYMPHTSSGVVVSHRSPKSLIANLITNKAAHSPSLPHRLLAGRKDVRHTPTIIRPGLPIRVHGRFEDVNWDKMAHLLEGSFRRKLDRDGYFARLQRCVDFVIVMGDYQGAAIVTHEWAPGEDPATTESIAYLDKFAVLPNLQGSGAVDFLWGALRDEVHGLGLLDALNDNGGKAGFGVGRDLVWKSRRDNPVNRWYYERSNGFVRIDTSPLPKTAVNGKEEKAADPAWCMFWADAEQRIAAMSGERRLGAEASTDDVLEMAHERTAFAHESRLRRQRQQAARRRSSIRELPYEEEAVQYDEDEESDENSSSSRSSPSLRRLSELYPTENSNGERLLPVVAPDEQGRLDRWARCMGTIPSAWAS